MSQSATDAWRRCFLSFLAQEGEICLTHITPLLLRSWSCCMLKNFGFPLISGWRSSILQEHIPWQGQALKFLMSSLFFALKHVTYLFKKGSSSLQGTMPWGFFSVQRVWYVFTLQCTPVDHIHTMGWKNLTEFLVLSSAQDKQALLLISEPSLDNLK